MGGCIAMIDDILPQRHLQILSWCFACPYCGRQWERGGGKEGFVKSGASNHVVSCWELLLFQAGYVPGDYVGNRGRRALTLADVEKLYGVGNVRRYRRLLLGAAASRRRAGLTPRVPIDQAKKYERMRLVTE